MAAEEALIASRRSLGQSGRAVNRTREAFIYRLLIHKQWLIGRLMQTDAVFRALADPTRRAVFEELTRGEAQVRELTARFDVSQPAISQHLAALRRAGLVSERRVGRNAFYRVKPRGLRPLVQWIEHYQAFWHERLENLKTLLKEMD